MGHDTDRMRQKTIILLDDDVGMRRSLCFLLEIHGYGVTTYADPAALLHDLATLLPTCAIVDIHLPGTDGLAIGQAMRDVHPGLSLIFITGRVDQRVRDGAADLGAVALLDKPFSDTALLDAVRRGVASAQQIVPSSGN